MHCARLRAARAHVCGKAIVLYFWLVESIPVDVF